MGKEAATLLVCADDLTGANDVGVQFARRGIRAIVLIHHEVLELPRGWPVVVVNTESRHLPPAEAAARVRRAVGMGRASGVRHFLKKTDSTLRGNVGAELAALADAAGAKLLPFVPALPQLGRTTRRGIHYVEGRPLHETAFGKDPMNPIRTSSVKEILAEQTDLPVHSAAAPDRVDEHAAGIVVFDAESVAGLRAIAAKLFDLDLLRACAGPAAFGEQLASLLPFPHSEPEAIHCTAPALIVNGSLNERSLEQVARGTSEPVTYLQLTPEWLLGEAPLENAGFRHSIAELPESGHLLLYSIKTRQEISPFLEAGRAAGLGERETHLRIARNTGALVKDLLRRRRFCSLVVFGGDTLMGIARACGWGAFIPLTEIADGLTLSRPEHESLHLISKAGGFGKPDVLDQILGFLSKKTTV